MRKVIVYVGGICLIIGVNALCGVFGFPQDISLGATAIAAIAGLANPTGVE